MTGAAGNAGLEPNGGPAGHCGPDSAPEDAVYGAIDLGTNNCRLLVARPTQEGFRVIDAYSRIVRLGEGMSHSGRLSEAAMARTIDALLVCAEKMGRREVTSYRAVATEACRQASNCEAFLARVAATTGIRLDIIPQREEVRLAAEGCRPLVDPEVPDVLIFDIGGGSTEISWARVERSADGAASPDHRLTLLDWFSMPTGVVSLSERYGGRDITSEVFRAMVEETAQALAPFEGRAGLRRSIAGQRLQMIGTSGTVTTLAGVHLKLPRYDRARVDGRHLEMPIVRRLNAAIAAMAYDERKDHGCIGAERADLVVAGCAILEALCELWPVPSLRVADRGLREGILLGLMREGRTGAWSGSPGMVQGAGGGQS